MRSVVDRNVVMRRIPVITQGCPIFFFQKSCGPFKNSGRQEGGGGGISKLPSEDTAILGATVSNLVATAS